MLTLASPVAPHRLIYTLREYPNTEDFVYLRRLDRNPSEYDPYALEVRHTAYSCTCAVRWHDGHA